MICYEKQTSEFKKIFSKNGEDEIISAIFIAIGIKKHCFVEFEVGNDNACNIRLSENERKCFWMDGIKSLNTNIQNEIITAENISFLFEKYSVTHELDLLSRDIDSNDY